MRERQTYERQARLMKALANATRLMILDQLREGEHMVSELTELAQLDQSTVSKHLAVLRSHGLVADRREGNAVFYRLVTPCVLDFFSCTRRVLVERAPHV